MHQYCFENIFNLATFWFHKWSTHHRRKQQRKRKYILSLANYVLKINQQSLTLIVFISISVESCIFTSTFNPENILLSFYFQAQISVISSSFDIQIYFAFNILACNIELLISAHININIVVSWKRWSHFMSNFILSYLN